MSKDEALKLALDLAIMHHSDDGYAELRSKVRQLAKEALAQPEQEPVAIDVTIEAQESLEMLRDMLVQEDGELTSIRLIVGSGQFGYGLYVLNAEYPEEGAMLLASTTPPQRPWGKPWVSLTDEFCITNMFDMGHYSLQIVFKSRKNADEFKAALKEKNT